MTSNERIWIAEGVPPVVGEMPMKEVADFAEAVEVALRGNWQDGRMVVVNGTNIVGRYYWKPAGRHDAQSRNTAHPNNPAWIKVE